MTLTLILWSSPCGPDDPDPDPVVLITLTLTLWSR
jgi:hypothetical protein